MAKEEKLYDLTNDFLFKAVFGQESNKNTSNPNRHCEPLKEAWQSR